MILAVLALVAMAVGWRYIGPLYDKGLVTLARPLGAQVVSIQAEGMELALRYRGQEESGPRWMRIQGLTLQYGALLVTSLILATPACAWSWSSQ